MGITFVDGVVTGPGGRQATVRFQVDSGAMYTLLPDSVWQAIGLTPRRAQEFTLADGTGIERQISECHIRLPQGEGHTPVILGQPGDAALLGIVTLEMLGLLLNPLTRELQPMHMRLSSIGGPSRG